MNNNLAVPDGDAWLVDRYDPNRAMRAAQATPDAPGLDFAALHRIISNWRWLILGAAAIGLIIGGAGGAGSLAVQGSKELKIESGTEMLVHVTR